MKEGVILWNYIISTCIQVDPGKVEVILMLVTPRTQTRVHSFLGYDNYYCRFIEKNFKNSSTFVCINRKCGV